MNPHLTIGEAAKAVGLPTKTIRYYESIQLLHPTARAENNYRLYSREDIICLSLIKQGRALGLSLGGVKQLVDEGLGGSCQDFKASMLLKLPAYIQAVAKRMTELRRFERELKTLQKNLTALHLHKPTERITEKDCCEVLEQMSVAITKGGGTDGAQER